MNVWNFTGNLGKDCEMSYAQNGDAICTFSVAVKSGYGDKQKTTWAKCAIFGKAASGQLPQYLTQGTQVAVSGEVCLDEWEKDGVKNKMLKVFVSRVDLIGSSQGSNAPTNARQKQQEPQSPYSAKQSTPQQNQPTGFNAFDDELNF
jgi:single-strand DNA-binding protein